MYAHINYEVYMHHCFLTPQANLCSISLKLASVYQEFLFFSSSLYVSTTTCYAFSGQHCQALFSIYQPGYGFESLQGQYLV